MNTQDANPHPSKKFLLFCGDMYYPRGGFKDFRGAFEILELARHEGNALLESQVAEWFHIVDIQTYKIVDSDNI